MRWLINVLTNLFQKRVPTPAQPTQDSSVAKEPAKTPAAVPEPQKPVPEPPKPVEVFGGGKSGGGGASAAIPAPEPAKPVVYDETVTFREALRLILKFEGGYVFDKDDPGGETNKGVIKKVYDEYRKSKGLELRSVKDISDDEVSDIYRTRYWLEGKCDKVPPCIAISHFDTCVNTGTGQSAKILQRVVGVKDDGAIGSGTLGKVTEVVGKEGDLVVAKRFLSKRRDFYNNLAQQKSHLQKFLKGWLNRVDTLEKYINDRKA